MIEISDMLYFATVATIVILTTSMILQEQWIQDRCEPYQYKIPFSDGCNGVQSCAELVCPEGYIGEGQCGCGDLSCTCGCWFNCKEKGDFWNPCAGKENCFAVYCNDTSGNINDTIEFYYDEEDS